MASYCSKCGSEIAEGTRFCPACGFDTMGQNVDNSGGYNQSNNQNYNQEKGSSGTLTVIAVFGIIWGIGAILVGIVLFAGASILSDFGLGEYTGLIAAGGVIFIVSAIMAFITAALIFSKKSFNIAWMCCLIGSVLALIGTIYLSIFALIPGIIGIIFFALMHKEKRFFTS